MKTPYWFFVLLLSGGLVCFFPSSPVQANAVKGAALFQNKGCIGCHAVREQGGEVGPHLDGEGTRRTRPWIVQQLTDPKIYKPDGIMPKLILSDQERNDLADYLLTLK